STLTSLLQARKRGSANTLNRASHASNSSRRTTPNGREHATCPVPAIASIKRRPLSHAPKLALILRKLFQRQRRVDIRAANLLQRRISGSPHNAHSGIDRGNLPASFLKVALHVAHATRQIKRARSTGLHAIDKPLNRRFNLAKNPRDSLKCSPSTHRSCNNSRVFFHKLRDSLKRRSNNLRRRTNARQRGDEQIPRSDTKRGRSLT